MLRLERLQRRVVRSYKEPNRGLGHSVVRWANVYVKRAANKVLGLTMSAAMSTVDEATQAARPLGTNLGGFTHFFVASSTSRLHNFYELPADGDGDNGQPPDGNATARHLQLISNESAEAVIAKN